MSGPAGSSGDPTSTLEALVQHELAVLKALRPRIASVGQSKYNGGDLNRMDVHCRVAGKYIRRSGSADFDDKLKMAREVRRQVARRSSGLPPSTWPRRRCGLKQPAARL